MSGLRPTRLTIDPTMSVDNNGDDNDHNDDDESDWSLDDELDDNHYTVTTMDMIMMTIVHFSIFGFRHVSLLIRPLQGPLSGF